jgi:hypothetical protein
VGAPIIRDPIGDHLLTPQNAALLVIAEQPSQIAALGALTLLGRAGAAISSLPAGEGGLAHERGREAPGPSQGAIDGAGKGAQRTR